MLIEESQGLNHLESLQNHVCQKIYENAYTLIEKYFQGEVSFYFLSTPLLFINTN